ncbi:MAG: thioester reductase domain-containing protein, partial [Candidatus Promineifilaceae bacterium]|nr:thioester reductase domain-containing protein [Candidatus Promineifilaceae bacterium]
ILFLGRDDFQVKIRGYRIELGDIEAAVARHSAVAQNVCVARETSPAQRHLVSYLVARENQKVPTAAELREFLRAQLPDYMIPAQFLFLEALPLLPNGKVDRQTLPVPDSGPEQRSKAYTAPRYQVEEEVAELTANILDLEQVGIHDSFFDLGGNSLLAARLIFQTREQFQVQIPLRQLFLQPTVAGLSQAIVAAQRNGHASGNGQHHGAAYDEAPLPAAITLAELQAEAILDPALSTADLPVGELSKPRHVLLTGATGFVGAFLVRDLLQETSATVHCLVRAADEKAALSRIKQNLATYGLWDDAFCERIVGLPGDLGRPKFGLLEQQYEWLAHDIDVIFHNGALVNFVYSYREHKAPNVLGTKEVLRLAAHRQLKAVHFISTLSVFHTGRHDDGLVYYENDDLDEIGVPFGGYAQSKWVGEKLVQAAVERGIPAATYRPGLVTGDSESGAWNTADMMSTMAVACAALGAVPDLDVDVDIVPVDYVSKAIVTLALQPSFRGKIFNINNPQAQPYVDLMDMVNEAGLRLRVMPFDQWRELLSGLARQLGGGSWNPYLPLLDEVTVEQVFMPAFDCRHTLQGLEGSGISCPAVDRDLLATYMAYLQLDRQFVRQ